MLAVSALLLWLLAAPALAADITVQVGAGGLNFEPSSVTAAVGDRIMFVIVGTHSVVSSSFEAPCQASTTNAFSTFSNAAYDVTTTEPRWFHCSVGTHCSDGGQVFALNPTESQSFAAFQAAAVGESAPAVSSAMSSMASMAASPSAAAASTLSISSMSGTITSSASRAASSAATGSSLAGAASSAASAAASATRPNSAGFVSAGGPSIQLAAAGLVAAAAMLLL